MDELISDLLKNLPELLAGLPLVYDDIPEDRKRTVLIIALHCVLNGPVGVNKSTTFPMVEGLHKIKDFVKTSNSGWKGFCLVVAARVKAKDPNINCGSKRKGGDYWPLA